MYRLWETRDARQDYYTYQNRAKSIIHNNKNGEKEEKMNTKYTFEITPRLNRKSNKKFKKFIGRGDYKILNYTFIWIKSSKKILKFLKIKDRIS